MEANPPFVFQFNEQLTTEVLNELLGKMPVNRGITILFH
jgi:hypothetical protein